MYQIICCNDVYQVDDVTGGYLARLKPAKYPDSEPVEVVCEKGELVVELYIALLRLRLKATALQQHRTATGFTQQTPIFWYLKTNRR